LSFIVKAIEKIAKFHKIKKLQIKLLEAKSDQRNGKAYRARITHAPGLVLIRWSIFTCSSSIGYTLYPVKLELWLKLFT